MGNTLLKWTHVAFSIGSIEMASPDILTRLRSESSLDYFLLSDEIKQSFQMKPFKTSSEMFEIELQLSSPSQL